MDSLKAAVQNGADAIYLGGKVLSARASAKNFDYDEIKEAVIYAHLRDVKIYVTVNTILRDEEIQESLDYLEYLCTIGVDGLIVQDLGLADIIRSNFPDIPLHGSTQMTVQNLAGALVLEKLGFSRVVMARETPLSEVELIRDNTNLEIEYFAHGALCVSYSGQCLMSSMIGGRSGNRGRCAQPCRKAYTLEGEKESRYYLSPRDLCTVEDLQKLQSAGVTTIKLEGRMKRSDYVATVTSSYRKALDNTDFDPRSQKDKLAQAFNRRFTVGLPLGARGTDYSSTDRPDNRGVVVGEVISQNRGHTELIFDTNIHHNDVLEFDTDSGAKTFQAPRDIKPGHCSFVVPFDIQIGEVRRIIDTVQRDEALTTIDSKNVACIIDFELVARIGELPRLKAAAKGITVEVVGDQPIEAASNRPITKDKIKSQLDRLGETDFILGDINIYMDERIFLPVSVLNHLRREVLEKWENKFIQSYERRATKPKLPKINSKTLPTDLKISVSFKSKEQLQDLDLTYVDRVYLEFIDEDIYKSLSDRGVEVYYREPKITTTDQRQETIERLQSIAHTGIVGENISSLQDSLKVAGIGLNIFNSYSLNLLESMGVTTGILSPELNLEQIRAMTKPIETEALAYGFLPVMTLQYCPFQPLKGCVNDRQCPTCQYHTDQYLKDEMNVEFRIERKDGISTLYNSYPISMVDQLDRIRDAGVDRILLDFTLEEDIQYIIDSFVKAIDKQLTDLDQKLIEKYKDITYGHYYRGID